MLGRRSTLDFPHLKYVGRVALVHHNEELCSERDLYRLDWDKRQASCLAQFDRSIFPSDTYAEYVQSRVYALSSEYLRGIHDNARQASGEWSYPYHFDTCVREFCMSPAQQHVSVAFYLLADCVYDSATKWYERSARSRILSHILTWSFWQGQTGDGLTASFAGINKLKKALDRKDGALRFGQDYLDEVQMLCDAIDNYESRWYGSKMTPPTSETIKEGRDKPEGMKG